MPRKNLSAVLSLSLIFLIPANVYAGTVTGPIQLASTGKGFPNGTLTFTLTQAAVVSGTATIVTSPVNCYTDGQGNVVGLPNPVALPVLSTINAGGTLPAGNYFVRTTWANSSGETAPGPERSINMTQAGALVVQAPANPPANATQWKIYISAATGAETLQATQTAPFTNYSQSSPLATGAAVPGSNTTTCSLRFNDELQPSYTGYTVTFTTATGATVPGFPQKWYLSGGSAGTINVGNGLPLYSGVVVYPQPIITNPAQSATQSINGPLNMNGFKLTDSNINDFLYVDGTTFTTVQQAINAACAVGGGTVYIPSGTYPQNSPFTLCSNLYLIGSGRSTCDQTVAPTTITTTITSGDLFPVIGAMDHVHILGMCIKNIGSGGGVPLHIVGGRFGLYQDLYLTGPWANGIIVSPNVGVVSAIWNTFRNIHHTGYLTGAAMVVLDALNTTSQVVNNNKFEYMTGNGGMNGFGVKVKTTGGTCPGNATFINENSFSAGQDSAPGNMSIGVSADNCTFRDLYMDTQTIEGNNLSISVGTGNSGFICLACEISSNTTNIPVDNSGPSGRTLITGNIGITAQNFSVDAAGNGRFNSICLGVAGCTTGNINATPGMAIQVASNNALTLNSNNISIGQQILLNGNTFSNGGGIQTMPSATGTLAEISGTQRFFAGCNGTASPSTTLTMPWPGTATTACTNTASTIQIPVTSAGTVKNLRVRCATGGVNASSGSFDILDTGGDTGIKCTIGTGTTCSDTMHTFAAAAGDPLLIQFTTQAAETLANCAVSFEIQ
ncbi:MAG TPA: hypothetical protein VHA33_01740 [Candidatus Angelobacter sp.]|nr:hypothetical protein [Candidatus Angelobacter sp.]